MDLTLVPIPPSVQEVYQSEDELKSCILPQKSRFKDNSLDFGTGYDCFDLLSHPDNPHVNAAQKKNRMMLKSIMEENGFKGLSTEWWHFTLRNEPFAADQDSSYFDFPIE